MRLNRESIIGWYGVYQSILPHALIICINNIYAIDFYQFCLVVYIFRLNRIIILSNISILSNESAINNFSNILYHLSYLYGSDNCFIIITLHRSILNHLCSIRHKRTLIIIISICWLRWDRISLQRMMIMMIATTISQHRQ